MLIFYHKCKSLKQYHLLSQKSGGQKSGWTQVLSLIWSYITKTRYLPAWTRNAGTGVKYLLPGLFWLWSTFSCMQLGSCKSWFLVGVRWELLLALSLDMISLCQQWPFNLFLLHSAGSYFYEPAREVALLLRA